MHQDIQGEGARVAVVAGEDMAEVRVAMVAFIGFLWPRPRLVAGAGVEAVLSWTRRSTQEGAKTCSWRVIETHR